MRAGYVTVILHPWSFGTRRRQHLLAALAAGMLLLLGVCPAQGADSEPARLKRSESFLGVHFDFHAGRDCRDIGKNTTPEMVNKVIDLVGPDYLQIDCKGHPGLSSYPTKVGNPAPSISGDPLRVWREATAARGVALYMHYSGVWDSEAVRMHPDWAVVSADGAKNPNITSFFSPYADQLLVPQLCELAGDYGVDGAWVDGECWAAAPDYGDAAKKAFVAATGIETMPRKPGDPHWFEFISFQREAFRKYLRHYLAEVKKTHPDFQLCSNWAFTDFMPEPVSAPLDFLSGDYTPEDSVNSARFSGRYLAHQGKPWDLMAWSFTRNKSKDGRSLKTAVQLQREAAVVLALGGGFQAYFQQKRDGSIFEDRIGVMGEVARFCRARQAICHRATQVPQVALLYSTAAYYRRSPSVFAPWGGDQQAMKGALQALLENQLSVEVLSEHHLTGRMQDYPLIVVPEWEYLENGFRDELAEYVRGGGSLLVIGPKACELFEKEIGAAADASPRVSGLGTGKIGMIGAALGEEYLRTHSAPTRQLVGDLARQLFPKPMVEVSGSADVDVVVNRLGAKLAVNLINTSDNTQEPILDVLPPVGPLKVVIRSDKRPGKVLLEPGARQVDFEYAEGEIRLALPGVEIHEIIVVE